MVTPSNGTVTDKTTTLYFPITISIYLGLFATGYELENTMNSQLIFSIGESDNASTIKIQAYRMSGKLITPTYARLLLISYYK